MQHFRVMLTMEVVPGKEAEFERAWQDGAGVITGQQANLGHWLARSTNRERVYYIISDWTDEPAFRAFENSAQHLEHRKHLHPYRSGGAFDTMTIVHGQHR